jgi:DNA-binding transcriptional LysR family regulator
MVLNGEVDIAAVSNPPQSPDLVTEPFRQEKLLAFSSPNHPLAKRGSLAISDLARIPLVIRGESEGDMTATEEILREIQNQGVEIKIAMRCDSYEAVKAAVRHHMGVGLLFEGLVMHDAKRGDFKILKIKGLNLVGQSFIIYHKEKPLSQNARDFLELLRKRRPKRSVEK